MPEKLLLLLLITLSVSFLALGCKTNEEAIKGYSRQFEAKLDEQIEVRNEIYFLFEELRSERGSAPDRLLSQIVTKSSDLKDHIHEQTRFMQRMAVPGGCARFHRDYLAYSQEAVSVIDEIGSLVETSQASGNIVPRLLEITPALFGYQDFPPRSGPADACPNLSGYS